jgi:hypothetical protein
MVQSAGDAEIIRQSEPYHRVAYEAIRDRNPPGSPRERRSRRI